jgi:hypothetical protein
MIDKSPTEQPWGTPRRNYSSVLNLLDFLTDVI